MTAHDTVNRSFPVCSDLAAVGKHLPSGLLYRQNQDCRQRRKRIDDYADTRIRSLHVSHRDRGGRCRSQWRRGWRHDGRHRNELGDTSGREESLSLEQDMARDSSVKRGNVAAMIAWQQSSQGNKAGEPQVAWPATSSRLGFFRSIRQPRPDVFAEPEIILRH